MLKKQMSKIKTFVTLTLAFILIFTYMFRVCFVVCVLISIMTANTLTLKTLRTILDEKLAPLKAKIAELRLFIDNASKTYDEVLKKVK